MTDTIPQNSAPPPTPPPEEVVVAQADRADLDLPEPDPENITVLSKSLPNKPILPWNRYDSPWQEEEEPPPEELALEESEGEAEVEAAMDAAEEPEPDEVD